LSFYGINIFQGSQLMLNEYQLTLFADLSALVSGNSSFFSKDVTINGTIYRMFNYRIVSYDDFTAPNALNCRGTMFEISIDGMPVRLASLPTEKFFNLYENPLTIGLDLSKIVNVTNKLDGSMVSSYMHNGVLSLKTKNSLDSDPAIAALKWLKQPEHTCFLDEIVKMEELGHTVIMEWCSNENQIVLNYDAPALSVLAIRNHSDGSYVDIETVYFPAIRKYWVATLDISNQEQFDNIIDHATDMEGIVVLFESGQRVKVKSKWYVNIHTIIFSVESNKALFIATIDQRIDDIKSLFYTNTKLLDRINNMEKHVQSIYNNVVELVEEFHESNKHLARKEYAILLKETLIKEQFDLAMRHYLGDNVDYKRYFIKYYRIYLPKMDG